MKRFAILAFISLFVVNTGLGACSSKKSKSSDDVVPKNLFGEYQEDPVECPPDECGANSPVVNGYSIDELHLNVGVNNGSPNHDGVRIVGFVPANNPTGEEFVLSATGGELIATSRSGIELKGAGLVNSQIILEATQDDTTMSMAIVIYAYDEAPNWHGTPKLRLPRYLVTYDPTAQSIDQDAGPMQTTGHATTPVCSTAAAYGTVTGDGGDADDRAWITVLTSVRYVHDTTTKRPLAQVQSSTLESDKGWFNLACRGHALYKTKFMGYELDPAPVYAAALQSRRSLDKHQATIKALTADYCGNNTSFTEDGELLRWENHHVASVDNKVDNEAVHGNAQFALEARWTGTGAICLDTPRHYDNKADVPDECAYTKPACSDPTLPTNWEWKTYKVIPAPVSEP